jgi:hypothetical protein
MDIEYPAFGTIVVAGTRYDHDIVIVDGTVRARDKRPSKAARTTYGHTPLTENEAIPWTKPRLVIGSGYSGRLPVTPGIEDQAKAHGVTLDVMPTAEACRLLREIGCDHVNAILHVTC